MKIIVDVRVDDVLDLAPPKTFSKLGLIFHAQIWDSFWNGSPALSISAAESTELIPLKLYYNAAVAVHIRPLQGTKTQATFAWNSSCLLLIEVLFILHLTAFHFSY